MEHMRAEGRKTRREESVGENKSGCMGGDGKAFLVFLGLWLLIKDYGGGVIRVEVGCDMNCTRAYVDVVLLFLVDLCKKNEGDDKCRRSDRAQLRGGNCKFAMQERRREKGS